MAARLPLRLSVLSTALVAACSLDVDDVASRVCSDDSGCPESYRCVAGTEGQGRCEVIYPPSSAADAGTVDAGG